VLEKAGELIEQVAPEFIKEMLQIERVKEVPISQATNLVTGTPGQPIPKQPQQAIYKAIQEGVKQGLFAVKGRR
jgi:aspartate/methionine/tyrosine aminotransferase